MTRVKNQDGHLLESPMQICNNTLFIKIINNYSIVLSFTDPNEIEKAISVEK